MVSFASTSTFGISGSSRERPRLTLLFSLRGGSARGLLGPRLGGRLEDAVARAGDAVLVRAADHGRDLVEVEDRRRGGALPLERERAPRVGGRAGAAAPARDH